MECLKKSKFNAPSIICMVNFNERNKIRCQTEGIESSIYLTFCPVVLSPLRVSGACTVDILSENNLNFKPSYAALTIQTLG